MRIGVIQYSTTYHVPIRKWLWENWIIFGGEMPTLDIPEIEETIDE